MTVVGMLVPLVIALVLWSLWRRGALPYQFTLLRLFTPDGWWWGGTIASPKNMDGAEARVVYDGVFFAVLLYAMGRLGSWPHVVRHFVGRRPQPVRALIALLGALAALSFVFPGAFGVGWDALPVVDPLFSLIVLISGGYELFASPCSRTPCTPSSRLLVVWPFARVGGWLPYAKELLAARQAGPRPRRARGRAAPLAVARAARRRAVRGGRPAHRGGRRRADERRGLRAGAPGVERGGTRRLPGDRAAPGRRGLDASLRRPRPAPAHRPPRPARRAGAHRPLGGRRAHPARLSRRGRRARPRPAGHLAAGRRAVRLGQDAHADRAADRGAGPAGADRDVRRGRGVVAAAAARSAPTPRST